MMGRSKPALFSLWMLLGALACGILLFIAALLVVWWMRPVNSPAQAPTAVVMVIPIPTVTPTPLTPTENAPEMPTVTAAPSSDALAPGDYVQVTGTGGDGLRLRTEAGLNGKIRALGSEGEIFQVRDGPRQVDHYTWWYLVATADETRSGWAVADYLSITHAP